MTDHADTVLQALHLLGPDPVDDDAELHEGQLHGYEALRLLVAERDNLQHRYEYARQTRAEAIGLWKDAKAKIAALEVACDFYSEDHDEDCGCVGCITYRAASPPILRS